MPPHGGCATIPGMNDRDDLHDEYRPWFTYTLALPDAAMYPAVAVKLARLNPDDAEALWQSWRHYAPTAPDPARAATFAAGLRRGVERVACAGAPHLAWVSVGPPRDAIPDSAWVLLTSGVPLSASLVRLLAGAGSEPVTVIAVQRGGERVPQDERGPFLLPAV